ncbi:MAG: signal peptidase I [Planctomycetota bacterium]
MPSPQRTAAAEGAPPKGRRRSRHPWRENIEALAIAVVVALLFKYFILEISKIPSGSMQPTLMGNPEAGVFDRVLVDKLSMRFRDPRRFEIVVFKHPLERSRIMVKRLVGMPGEDLRIVHGDLWTRPGASAEWTILRRPPAVQAQMWKALDLDDPPRSSWRVAAGGTGWRTRGREIEALGPGRVDFRAGQRIQDGYLDGYPDSLRDAIRRYNRNNGGHDVGDLRVTGEIRAAADLGSLTIELSEGPRRYELVVPGPAAPPDALAVLRMRGGASAAEPPVERFVPFRLPAGRRVSFAGENLDDRLALEVDGELLAALDVPPADGLPATLSLALAGGGADLADLQVWRDVYYQPEDRREATWAVSIPPGEYVMLGDNTQDSADGRDWEAIPITWIDGEGETRAARGNSRDGENPISHDPDGPSPAGPLPAITRFRDEWGELHWFPTASARPGTPLHHSTVPRELIQGRAVAVFWPLKPHRDLWRLAWLP